MSKPEVLCFAIAKKHGLFHSISLFYYSRAGGATNALMYAVVNFCAS